MARPQMKTPHERDIAIGLRLRGYRKARKLSQSDVGQALGVTFQQIQKYENGRNRLSGSRLVDVCELLDIGPSQLLGSKSKGDGADPFDIVGDLAVARALNAFRQMTKPQRAHAADMVVAALQMSRERNRATKG